MTKHYMNVPVWKYRLILGVLHLFMALVIFGLGAGVTWVHASNEELYERKAQLETRLAELTGEIEKQEAEAARLSKTTAR